MQDRYSNFVPAPHLPSDMVRSAMLSIEFKISSVTAWVANIKGNHLHALLRGFNVGDTPGIGTFYDFFSRLWFGDKNNLTDAVHPPPKKLEKPKDKEEKAPPLKKVTVNELFEKLEQEPPTDMDACTRPASDSDSDLPVFPLPQPVSRHDSHGFLYNFSMKKFLLDVNITKPLLNPAHDAMPYCLYCKKHHITPFIDLNGKGSKPPVYKNDLITDDDGDPTCKEGSRMRCDGTETIKGRTKFKCPKISFANGTITCTCEHPCSDAKYGRTIHLTQKDNPKLFNDPPKSSKKWKLKCNARTSADGRNKHGKIDYKLEDGRHRSTKMWYCRLFTIMMCQHLDA